MKKLTLLRTLLVISLTRLALAQQPATPPTTLPASMQSTIKRLSSDNFAVREAAQKDLDKLTWRDLDLLQQLIETTSDPEATAHLSARLATIKELIASDPPPISLELKNATLTEVIVALEKATGEPLTHPDKVDPALTFTLSAKDQPFWQVVADLSKQHDLRPARGKAELSLLPPAMLPNQATGRHDLPPVQLAQYKGGIAIFVEPITRTPASNTYNFQFLIALDPRIKILSLQPKPQLHIVDDAGNSLADTLNRPGTPGSPPPTTVGIYNLANVIHAELAIPQTPGKKIASASFEFHALIGTAVDTVEIPDVTKVLKQPIAIGNTTVTITNLEKNGVYMALTPPRPSPNFSLSLFDANNLRIFFWSPIPSSFPISSNAPGPFKMQLSNATKTQEIIIPFELQSLPLPAAPTPGN